MKTLTSVILAAALIAPVAAPTAANAARHTTPGQMERHAANLADDDQAIEQHASNDRQQRDRVPAAKAGKVTVAPAANAAAS